MQQKVPRLAQLSLQSAGVALKLTTALLATVLLIPRQGINARDRRPVSSLL